MYPVTNRRRNDSMTSSLNRLSTMLDEAFGFPFGPGMSGTVTSAWVPATDVFEDRNGIKIVAELPGVRPEDVKLSLENNMLTIRGEKRQQAEENTERVHRYERSYGTFERTFALPNTVDAEGIEAHFDDGLLTITLPKAERARPREIQVKSGVRGGQSSQAQLGEHGGRERGEKS
ncbi:MAG TPA: Hsp20/alpha crystallin family protein [Gemmatimonadales bacterium]|nr:Hsp20/alpha crystallin family protein [Gemmatimonadales bacterium]